MNIPKEIRDILCVLLLVFSVQLAGNGVLTILGMIEYENQQFFKIAAVAFGLIYIGVGVAGVYVAYRLYRHLREANSTNDDAGHAMRRRRQRSRRL